MERILVALDGSAFAPVVLERAVELARATGAKLRLFTAITLAPRIPPPSVDVVLPFGDEDPVALLALADARLRAHERSIPEPYRDGVVSTLGRPAPAICTAARAYEADMVVIGAHGYGVLERVLGTTAARVANRIDRPLLVIRPVPREATRTTSSAHP